MKIEYSNTFKKNYKNRIAKKPALVKRYQDRLRLFIQNSTHPFLKDHQLRGNKLRTRAFSITGDVRVIYKIIDDTILFLDIGTHNQVY